MAKVKFEFDLHEDAHELRLYKNIDSLYFALDSIYNSCRQQLKYGNEELSNNIYNLLDEIKSNASIIHELD